MSNIKAKSPSDRTEEIKRMAREIANADYENSPRVRELRYKAKLKKEEAERAAKAAEKPVDGSVVGGIKKPKVTVSSFKKNPATGCTEGTKGDEMGKVMLEVGAADKEACIDAMTKRMARLMDEEGDNGGPKKAGIRASLWYMTRLRDKPEIYGTGGKGNGDKGKGKKGKGGK